MSFNLYAGFECATLHWNGHDLLHSTNHTPQTTMKENYLSAIAQGVKGARDGLVNNHDPYERLLAAPSSFHIIWDLVHFSRPENPFRHAHRCGDAIVRANRVYDSILAVNEPSASFVSGIYWSDMVATGIAMMKIISSYRTVDFYTCDPIHNLDEHHFNATDALVDSGYITTVGINYYPHHAQAPLSEIIQKVHDRYRLPVMITETGWHDGLHEAHSRFPHVKSRKEWLTHVENQIIVSGVNVQDVCWYPWLDMPDWDNPEKGRWPCGYPTDDYKQN